MQPTTINHNPIIDLDGVPCVLAGSFKFKKDVRFRVFNLQELNVFCGFKVEDVVVAKSEIGKDRVIVGAVVPDAIIKKMAEKEEPKLVGADGQPLEGKKK